ncbi:MAG: hypothetical protein DRI94_13655 [Bacteroidetes bacterium]|nr:MAG: hypothetical protein DRI94_13655 [Bacteroidota bacterium]
MNFEIDSDIINKTHCDKDFICLKEEAEDNICKINKCFDDKFCSISKAKFENCINCFSFGYSRMCKCPVRIEIFKKYGI